MGAYLLSASQYATASLAAWVASLQESLDAAMLRAEGYGAPGQTQQSGSGLAIGVIIAIAVGVVVLCLLPICVIAVLTLLGPSIGNVFSNITDNI